MANVFAHNVRITQPDSNAPFDGSFDDGSTALIRFVLCDFANTLEVKVLDGTGTLVRTLTGTDFNSGDTSVVWDGLNDAGAAVAVGDYSVSIATSQTGYADYEVLYDVETGIWTRGVSSVKTQDVRNFGFQYALSGGGYVSGVARHANDGSQWGDVKGNAQLTVESEDAIGSDNFRYSATADSEGNIFAGRRSGTVPAVYMMNVDEQVMRKVDADDWGGQRPQGITVSGGASSGYMVVSNHIGDVYGMDLDGSDDYFATQSDLLVSTNPGSATTDLFFSAYMEGSSNNKGIEIFNGTDSTISLDDYQIAQSNNGDGWEYYHVFPSGASIASGDVWVIITDQMDPLLYDAVDADEVLGYPSVVHHNGNDARALIKSADSTIVDVIGIPDSSYAAGDTTLSVPSFDVAGVVGGAKDHTLIRKSTVYMGNDDWAASAGTDADNSEWIVEAQNYIAFGSHTMDFWDAEDNAVFWDVTLGRDNLLYTTFQSNGADSKNGVACFDLATYVAGTPFTLKDATWKVVVDSSLAHTLTYYFADDAANDILYYTLNDAPKWEGIGIWAIDVAAPTVGTQIYADPDMNMSSYRSDIAMDAVGNIVFWENSNEYVRLISPPGGNSYEYVNNFDLIKVFVAETIADVRIDADADGVPDRLDEVVTVVGIVTSYSFSAGLNIPVTIQDATGAIYLYGWDGSDSSSYAIGDRIKATGTIAHYNGLTELDIAAVEDLEYFGTETPPAPIELTVEEWLADAEKYESMLIKISGLNKDDGEWPADGSNANLTMTDGFFDFTMRVDKDLDLDGQVEPIYPVDLIGVTSQYSTATPPLTGYQVFPRQYSDIAQDVAVAPSPYFFFTDETRSFDGGVMEIDDSAGVYKMSWHPAIDLNGDDLIYQFVILDAVTGAELVVELSDDNGADTTSTPTGEDIIDLIMETGTDSLTVKITLRTAGEGDIVASVDTIMVTFKDLATSIDEFNNIPKEFFVDQNYPNPFNPSTSIQFGLPAQADVTLIIYDILGREVARLINNQVMNAGTYKFNFNASQLASGTYIYRLQADQKVEVKKMLLLK
jgi:hypothetical protein